MTRPSKPKYDMQPGDVVRVADFTGNRKWAGLFGVLLQIQPDYLKVRIGDQVLSFAESELVVAEYK